MTERREGELARLIDHNAMREVIRTGKCPACGWECPRTPGGGVIYADITRHWEAPINASPTRLSDAARS